MLSTAAQPCIFRLRHARARRVYLVGDFSRTGTEVLAMEHVMPDQWVARLRLSPGTYRFHYYVEEDGVLTYYAPTGGTGGGGVENWSAVLRVAADDDDGGGELQGYGSREVGCGTNGRHRAPRARPPHGPVAL